MDVREKLIEQAISHFSCGVSHDIFSDPVTTYAKLAIEALEKEKEIGVTVQEWISVTERLPDYFTGVLVWCPGNKCIYAAYRNVRQEWCTFDDTIAGHVVVNMVTHWMPMPQPPKGE